MNEPDIKVFDVSNDCYLALVIRKDDRRPDLHLNCSREQASKWLREIALALESEGGREE